MSNCEQSFHGVQVGLSQDENCVAAGVVESPQSTSPKTYGLVSELPRSVSLVAGYTFLSDGRWSLTRPSSSHLTIASSSLVCSTVPNAPVGFPKLPKPSTRSPGFNTWSVVAASASGGFLARSESGAAPAYARGGWGALRNFGIGLLVIWLILEGSLSERQAPLLLAKARRLDTTA